METRRMFLILFVCFLPFLLIAESPLFSVRIGPKLQSSQIGLQIGSIQPYVGLDYLCMGLDASMKETYSVSLTDASPFLLAETSTTGMEGNVRIWMPHVGLRYYLNTNKTKPYLFANLFKALPSIDGKESFDLTAYDEQGNMAFVYSESEDLDKATKDMLEDLLGIWGLNFGFGAEYTVNEYFSIGGEFGFKMARSSVSNKNTEIIPLEYYYYYYYGYYSDYNFEGLGDVKSVAETDANVGLTFSYAAICVNFHF